MSNDGTYLNVKTAFLAMTELLWDVLSESDFEFEALLESLESSSEDVRDSAGWSVWVRSIRTVTEGRALRSSSGAWVTLDFELHAPSFRSYDFSSGVQILLEDGYRAVHEYVGIFRSTAGPDSLTLISDTEIEPDGGPFDAAAWDDWLAAVQRVTNG